MLVQRVEVGYMNFVIGQYLLLTKILKGIRILKFN